MEKLTLEVAGLYSATHFVYLLLLFSLIVVFTIIVSKYGRSKIRQITMIVSIVVTIAEIIKIGYFHYTDVIINKLDRPNIHSWVPLSFCSLFIYSSWLASFKNKVVRKIGITFIVSGGLFAGFAFLIYPSTAVGLYPPISFLCIHGMVYHSLMVFVGLINLLFGDVKPTIKNFIYYIIFCVLMFSIAIYISFKLDINLMFFRDPFGLPQIVKEIFSYSKYVYMVLVGIAYLMLYFVSFVVYKIIEKIKIKKR